jgi:hypothetical protein
MYIGFLIGTTGVLIAAWCIFTFARIGRGTPAPFDPPRRLVILGPYRFVASSRHNSDFTQTPGSMKLGWYNSL